MPRNLGKRVALVMGVEDYEALRPLQRPVSDARAVAAALKELGFELERSASGEDFIRDPERGEALTAREDFLDRTRDADIALFYFSGHAVQVDGANYLLLKDSSVPQKALLNDLTLPLSSVLERMRNRASNSIIILDACRNDPFRGQFLKDEDDNAKGVTLPPTGLAGISLPKGSKSQNPRTVHIIFSTSDGATAADMVRSSDAALLQEIGNNSPFTAALLKHIKTPGLSISDMVGHVSATLQQWTGFEQQPWHNSLPGSPVRLNPIDEPQEPAPPPEVPRPPFLPAEIAKLPESPAPISRPKAGRTKRRFAAVAGVIAFGVFTVYPRVVSPPPNPIAADPTSADLTSLLSRIGDINADDSDRRRRAVAALEAALGNVGGLQPVERQRLASGLTRLAMKPSRDGLSAEGRYNAFYLLAKVEPNAWQDEDWAETRAGLRRALLDLQADATSGGMQIGAQTQAVVDSLRGRVFAPAETRSTNLNFSNQQYGGSMSRADAGNIQAVLTALSWKVLGLDGTRVTTAAAVGVNAVRYGPPQDRPAARRLALDLLAAGVPVLGQPVSTPNIDGKGPIEVWVSTPVPADRWRETKPVAAWCFQGREEGAVFPFSVRCLPTAAECKNKINERSAYPTTNSQCQFMPFLDEVQWPPGWIIDDLGAWSGGPNRRSYYMESPAPFARPYPAIPE
ncbi:caspase family protein (plasmid) [Bosea vestrisii]|uniref:caspase family protein n=1 Tax=Bosea vestrisii TaxID=151416 RepID=UPI0024DF84A3|nr:caspase family protein [Bosea vestrisii]WID99684.1 caspase family protein [Bosea vestrisii]